MQNQNIWRPIEFDIRWNNAKTEKFDNSFPSWERRRAELSKHVLEYHWKVQSINFDFAICDFGIDSHQLDHSVFSQSNMAA